VILCINMKLFTYITKKKTTVIGAYLLVYCTCIPHCGIFSKIG